MRVSPYYRLHLLFISTRQKFSLDLITYEKVTLAFNILKLQTFLLIKKSFKIPQLFHWCEPRNQAIKPFCHQTPTKGVFSSLSLGQAGNGMKGGMSETRRKYRIRAHLLNPERTRHKRTNKWGYAIGSIKKTTTFIQTKGRNIEKHFAHETVKKFWGAGTGNPLCQNHYIKIQEHFYSLSFSSQ